MANHDLLLLHGTIYGYAQPVLPVIQFNGRSSSYDAINDPVDWRGGLFGKYYPIDDFYGGMTFNEPVDFIHWPIDGRLGETGLEWWQQCMSLFMRHI